MRNESTKVVLECVRKDRNVIAVTADNGNEIYDLIREKYPNQYVDYGIAECNMVAGAAGMASEGKIPFLYAVTNFLAMRAYEFIRNIVCVKGYNVKFLGRSAGVVTGTYGMTHQGTEDAALLRTLPGLLTITPSTPLAARRATEFAYRYNGPVYIRLEGHSEPEHYSADYQFQVGKGTVLRSGTDASVITMGSIVNEALCAADELERQTGKKIRVIDMPMIKPIDIEMIIQAAKETKHILTLEEHSIYGGLGSAVAEVLAEYRCSCDFSRMGLEGYPAGCGNRDDMREINRLTSPYIIRHIQGMIL